MRKTRIAAGALCVCLLAGGTVWYLKRPQSPAFALLSPDEIGQYEDTPEPLTRNLTVNASNGPAIQVSAPKGYSLASPVDFDIRVEPRDGVAVNMASIKIEYKLGPAWINMTRRIMKYASVKGSRLYARGAELPKGQHALRVSIEDAQQRVTMATVQFTVTR